MKRRLVTLASAVCSLLCAATVVLWVRSYRTDYVIVWHRSDADVDLELNSGTVINRVLAPTVASTGPNRSFSWYAGTINAKASGGFGRMKLDTVLPDGTAAKIWITWFPMWLVVILFGLPAPVWLTLVLRSRRLEQSCVKCGYNLTGNTSGTCPECGTAIPQPNNKQSPRPA